MQGCRCIDHLVETEDCGLIILYELLDIGFLGAFGIICDHQDIILDERRSKRIQSYYNDLLFTPWLWLEGR